MIINSIIGGSSGEPVATIDAIWPSGSNCTCSCNGNILQGGTSGNTTFELPSTGTWTVACSNGSESASQSVAILPNSQTVTLSYITYQKIGGRIFYDDGSNGATYRFFDASYNEITTQTVSGLANAVYYAIVSGTPTKDRWYVYYNTVKDSVQWGKYGTSIGITSNGIGKGKTNTATALAQTGWESNSIFTWIQQQRTNELGGCNDWFIASQAEQDKLRASGLVTWYSSKSLWSSVEKSSDGAYYWYYDDSFWGNDYKDGTNSSAFAARAF